MANDAAVQGYGAIQGKGVELALTLGTGMGSSLFTDGHLCPGLELAHHPWRKKGMTYEDYLGRRGLDKYGKTRWNNFLQAGHRADPATFNWDHLYLGGGNTKKIYFKPGPNVIHRLQPARNHRRRSPLARLEIRRSWSQPKSNIRGTLRGWRIFQPALWGFCIGGDRFECLFRIDRSLPGSVDRCIAC